MTALWYPSPRTISRTRTTLARSLFVVTPLRRGNLAVHVVESAATTHENSSDGEHSVGAESVIDPLTEEQKGDDGDCELYPDTGEIGAGQALFGAGLRPLFVFHSREKLTACEDFHKRSKVSFQTKPEDL
jgi:hypothetical protein